MCKFFKKGSSRRWLDQALLSAEAEQQHGVIVSRNIVHHMVVECTRLQDLELGRRVQALMVYGGVQTVAILANHLIRLFASSKSCIEANQSFSMVIKPDQYTWSAIINVHAKLAKDKVALQLFDRMPHDAVLLNRFIVLSTLKACSNLGDIALGTFIHGQIVDNDIHLDIIVGNAMVDMYVKCGSLERAHKVFDELPIRDVFSWGAIIEGYAKHDQSHIALECFESMQHGSIKPNKVIFLSILKACTNMFALEQGRHIHEQIIACALQDDIVLGSSLIDMYAKCWSLEEACMIFEILPNQDVVSWGAMIAGYAHHGECQLALDCFEKMKKNNTVPDKISFLSILKACGSTSALQHGRSIHEQIMRKKLHNDILVGNALIDMYAKCGGFDEADNVFLSLESPDAVSWTSIIASNAQQGHGGLALQYFEHMQCAGIKPTKATYMAILKACSSVNCLEQGSKIHEQIEENGLQSDSSVGTTLVNMYIKCGNIERAYQTFKGLSSRDATSWGVMIGGYVEHGKGRCAVECFEDMQLDQIKPDKVTYLTLLKACASTGAIEHGRQIHRQIIESGFESDIIVGSALINMYAKCGSVDDACTVFNKLLNRDVVLWSTMIVAYAELGEAVLSVQYYENMLFHAIKPDNMTFSGILSALSHAGLLEESIWYFKVMIEFHNIKPDVYHTTCMVDLSGNSGRFNEAKHLLSLGPQFDIGLWMTLLSSCRLHYNVQLGQQCFDAIVLLDPLCAGAYVLMSNIYARAHTGEMFLQS